MDIHTKGARVIARYCGGEFTGTLTGCRRHTINMQAFEYDIAPDGPFESAIGTLDRQGVYVYASWEGEPISFDHFDGSVRLA